MRPIVRPPATSLDGSERPLATAMPARQGEFLELQDAAVQAFTNIEESK
jgi:hypothetical protein